MDTKINIYIFIHFPKSAEFSYKFDSNISTQRFVNINKLTFKINDVQKWRRKHTAMMAIYTTGAPGDVTSLAQKLYEY